MIAYSMSRGKSGYNPIQAYRAFSFCVLVLAMEKGQSFTPSPVPKHRVPQQAHSNLEQKKHKLHRGYFSQGGRKSVTQGTSQGGGGL